MIPLENHAYEIRVNGILKGIICDLSHARGFSLRFVAEGSVTILPCLLPELPDLETLFSVVDLSDTALGRFAREIDAHHYASLATAEADLGGFGVLCAFVVTYESDVDVYVYYYGGVPCEIERNNDEIGFIEKLSFSEVGALPIPFQGEK